MRQCSVSAQFLADGRAQPQQIQWGFEQLNVIDIGRRWSSNSGQHVLVRVGDGRVFELMYNGASWLGEVRSQPPSFA